MRHTSRNICWHACCLPNLCQKLEMPQTACGRPGPAILRENVCAELWRGGDRWVVNKNVCEPIVHSQHRNNRMVQVS